MKTIRTSLSLVGLFLVLFALGARGQGVYSTRFAGTFTLPFAAQWGALALPAGDYTLEYGTQESGGRRVVVQGTAKGSPHGMILAGPRSRTSTAKNAIVCVREGNVLIVRALEMPAIGQSASFAMPRGAQLVARNGKHNEYTQLAEVPMLIQRILVSVNAK